MSAAWVKHHAADRYCAVAAREGGSVATVCRGRFPITDAHEQADAVPADAVTCRGCLAIANPRAVA